MERSTLSVLARGGPGRVAREPFPHLVVEQALGESQYASLADRFPSTDTILRGRGADRSNSAARLPFLLARDNPAVDPLWQEFFAYHVSRDFWRDIVRVYGDVIRAQYAGIERKVGRALDDWRVAPRDAAGQVGTDIDVGLDCQFVVNTPVKRVSQVRSAHVDEPNTLFSGLFYLRIEEDTVTGGDLELAKWRRHRPRFLEGRMILPSDIEVTKTIGYTANTLACFINSPLSVHSVTPRSPTPIVRRYINLIAKVGFDLFEGAPVGPIARRLHAREIRRVANRWLAGDREQEPSYRGATTH